MDLHNIETYLRPTNINFVKQFDNHSAWLAGGTWLFSEPQPHLKTLIDMQSLDWSEIEVVGDNLIIGATCPLIKLLKYTWPPEWTATSGFTSAISALAASLKVVNMATIGGNICLALSIGTLAPLMVALNASYEILNLQGKSSLVSACDFQTGARETILQPQEVLRRVLIPLSHLTWKIDYQRFGIAASDPALAIVVSTYNQISSQLRVVIAASVAAPYCLEYDDVETLHVTSLQEINFINDARASATYRQEMTKVLIKRSLSNLSCKII